MKKWIPLITGLTAASAAWLVYGTVVTANQLTLERRRLGLHGWPERLRGYKIAVLADLHIRDAYSVRLAQEAVAMALEQGPDMVVLPGDLVGYWKSESPWLLGEALEALLLMEGAVIATPGNHDYWSGDAGLLAPILDELNIKLLRNESWRKDGIQWVGIDSGNEKKADPITPMVDALSHDDPIVVLWHEPDFVKVLPPGAQLMISGHSHGGQWVFPWGWQPMGTKNGSEYVRGFYPHAMTPLYVSRGVGTTGPPARSGALPEVSLLELYPA